MIDFLKPSTWKMRHDIKPKGIEQFEKGPRFLGSPVYEGEVGILDFRGLSRKDGADPRVIKVPIRLIAWPESEVKQEQQMKFNHPSPTNEPTYKHNALATVFNFGLTTMTSNFNTAILDEADPYATPSMIEESKIIARLIAEVTRDNPLTVIRAHGGSLNGQHIIRFQEGNIPVRDVLNLLEQKYGRHSNASPVSRMPVLFMSCNPGKHELQDPRFLMVYVDGIAQVSSPNKQLKISL